MTEQTKHTPGPWRAEQVRMGGPSNPYLAWSVQGKGGCVAEIRYTGIHPKNQIGEDEANARLIAAAPDLLAALEMAAKFINGELIANALIDPRNQNESPTLITFIRAALSKARES